ncbi:MAG: hypothetical protein HOP17_09265 [Acidobacteria bacterium]|nr:hypothetical protein [Acidobacteriota bacterium]
MNEHLLALVHKYRSKGILIDANIALLYVVGSFDIKLVRNHPRTSEYTEEDFELASKFIDFFKYRITTPHVLTEVSNLLGKNLEARMVLAGYLTAANEILHGCEVLSKGTAFLRFGLTDSAIYETSKNQYLVFTDDGPLYGFLGNNKIDVVNLEQVRTI